MDYVKTPLRWVLVEKQACNLPKDERQLYLVALKSGEVLPASLSGDAPRRVFVTADGPFNAVQIFAWADFPESPEGKPLPIFSNDLRITRVLEAP